MIRFIRSALISLAACTAPVVAADRVVILEEFTATWCQYCPPVGIACSDIMDANPDRFIMLQVHLSDAYTYTWGSYRNYLYSVTGLPTTFQDGFHRRLGEFPAETYQSDFQARANVPTDVVLEMTPRHLSGGTWFFDITTSLEAGAAAPRTMIVHLVQVLDHYPTFDAHWRNCVVQGILPGSTAVITLQPGESRVVTYHMTLTGASWNPTGNRARAKFVAWVQRNGDFPSGSEIYQAAQLNWRQLMPTDLNGNGTVDLSDLAILLAHFGTTADALPEEGDTDGDGDVDLQDLSLFLADFGI